jgi:hypothetical protein
VQEEKSFKSFEKHVFADIFGVLGFGNGDDIGKAAVHEVDDDPVAAFIVENVDTS